MAMQKGPVVAAAIVAVAVIVAAPTVLERAGGDHSGHHPALSRSGIQPVAAAAGDQIVIDSSIPETFVPASATATAGIGADAAWQAYAQLNGSSVRVPPSDVAVELGYLTLPVGAGDPKAYTANDELVWSFHWQSCPPSTGLSPSPPPQTQCVEWLFLDASTGAEIDDTWQQ